MKKTEVAVSANGPTWGPEEEPGARPSRALAQMASRLHGAVWAPADAATIFGCVLLAQWLSPVFTRDPLGPEALRVAAIHTVAFVLTAFVVGLYDWDVLTRWAQVAARSTAAAMLSLLLTLAVFYWVFYQPIGRRVVGFTAAASSLLLLAPRYVIWSLLPRRRVAFLGDTPLARKIVEALERDRERSYQVIAGWRDEPLPSWRRRGSRPEELVEICRQQALDELVLPDVARRDGDLAASLRCLPLGCRIRTEPAFYEDTFRAVPVQHVSPSWMLGGGRDGADHLGEAAKRAFDVTLALLLLTLAAPLAAAALALVFLEDGRPVFYGQTREGRFGRPFRMLKVRTMRPDAEQGEALWARKDDPRRTRVGRILRRIRLDEVPQLLNVLRGEMSFVGPRPERPEIVHELESRIPFYAWRKLVRPGLTGWAQIRLPYAASVEDAERKLELDLYYVRHASVLLDLAIVLRTVTAVMKGGR